MSRSTVLDAGGVSVGGTSEGISNSYKWCPTQYYQDHP